MESLEDIFKRTEIAPKAEKRQISPDVSALVNAVFAFFMSICRGFRKQYQDLNLLSLEKTQWCLAFEDAGIKSQSQIEFAIKRCRRESPINTPTIGQFLDWCMPESSDIGLPETEIAYQEACANAVYGAEKSWTHKLIRHAAKLTGQYFLSSTPKSVSYPVFARNYEIAKREFLNGAEIEEIQVPLAIENKSENVQINPEIRKKSISECLKMLGRHDLAKSYGEN